MKKRYVILSAVLPFFIGAVLVVAPESLYPKTDYVKFVESSVGIVKAYSEYQICNPTLLDITTTEKSLQNFDWEFYEVNGKLIDSWFEIRVDKTYEETEFDKIESCQPYYFTNENKTETYEENCTTTYKERVVDRSVQVWEIFEPTNFNYKTKECYNIRIYGTYKPAYRENSIKVDNVLSFAGYRFNEYAWWNASWGYYRKIFFDNKWNIETLENFTTLIYLTASEVPIAKRKADWTDLRFLDDDESTELYYHIENYTSTDAYVWVRVPQIDGGSDTDFIYMYYDYASAPDVTDSNNTYDANYTAVYNFNESATPYYDETKNDYSATSSNVDHQYDGRFGYSGDYDGTATVNTLSSAVVPVDKGTMMFWLNSSDPYPAVLGGIFDVAVQEMTILWRSDLNIRLYHNNGFGTFSPTIESNTWYFMAVTYATGGTCNLYLNGTAYIGTFACSGSNFGANVLTIGAYGTNEFVGQLDEWRVLNYNMSANYINASYTAQTGTWLTFGSESTPPTTTTTTIPSETGFSIAVLEERKGWLSWLFDWFYEEVIRFAFIVSDLKMGGYDITNVNHINGSGNYTGNVPYGEMWNYTANATAWTFEIDAPDIYYNLTNMTAGDLNGFTFTSTDQVSGGSYLTSDTDGIFKACMSTSMRSATTGGLYGMVIAINNDVSDNRDCYTRHGGDTTVNSMNICCFIEIERNDNISLQIEDEVSPAKDMMFHTINLNLIRVGD